MTTFDAERVARGWALVAEGAMEISLAYSAIDSASAREAVPEAGGAKAVSPQPSPAPADIPLKPQVDAGLSICPIHGTPWTIKAAGTTKTGKPYKAFWRCNERDADGFCSEKPQRIWQDTHPIREGAAA